MCRAASLFRLGVIKCGDKQKDAAMNMEGNALHKILMHGTLSVRPDSPKLLRAIAAWWLVCNVIDAWQSEPYRLPGTDQFLSLAVVS